MSARLIRIFGCPDVNLQRKQIGDTEMDMISHLYHINYHTFTFNFSNNQITHMGVMPLCAVRWQVLTRLNLECNRIGNRGCQYLSRCTLPKLQELNLNECGIEDPGMIHLAKAVLPCLEELKLQRNKIMGERISWLSKAPWPKLRIINLWTNSAKHWLLLRLSVYLTCPGNADLYLDFWRVDLWTDNRILREIYQQRSLRPIRA